MKTFARYLDLLYALLGLRIALQSLILAVWLFDICLCSHILKYLVREIISRENEIRKDAFRIVISSSSVKVL
jgi:hypothetical protein